MGSALESFSRVVYNGVLNHVCAFVHVHMHTRERERKRERDRVRDRERQIFNQGSERLVQLKTLKQ